MRPESTTTDPILAIGPANYAGQAYEWAEAVNRYTDARAWSFMRGPVRRRDFRFPAHRIIHPLPFYLAAGRRWRSGLMLRGTTHVALDGYVTYFRWRGSPKFASDARWLSEKGFRVALIAHGSDVRDPLRHMERLRWSYFREGPDQWREQLVDETRRNRGIAAELGFPLFVSTPDLLLDLPGARWLPGTVDVRAWESNDDILRCRRPRVLHLPSKRHPPIKGTQYIDPVLRRMEAAGLVEYISPPLVPHRDVKALVASCDIVIDQILNGWDGIAAVEAMAAGRVVVGGLAPDVAELMPEAPQLVNADPDTLEARLLEILDDKDAARSSAAANVEFVRRWHDGRAAAAVLEPFLGIGASTSARAAGA